MSTSDIFCLIRRRRLPIEKVDHSAPVSVRPRLRTIAQLCEYQCFTRGISRTVQGELSGTVLAKICQNSWKSTVQERLQPIMGCFQLSECIKSSFPYSNSLPLSLFCSLYYLWILPQRSTLNTSAAFWTAQPWKKKLLISIQPLQADKWKREVKNQHPPTHPAPQPPKDNTSCMRVHQENDYNKKYSKCNLSSFANFCVGLIVANAK